MSLFASVSAEAISGIDFKMDQVTVEMLTPYSLNLPVSVPRSIQSARSPDQSVVFQAISSRFLCNGRIRSVTLRIRRLGFLAKEKHGRLLSPPCLLPTAPKDFGRNLKRLKRQPRSWLQRLRQMRSRIRAGLTLNPPVEDRRHETLAVAGFDIFLCNVRFRILSARNPTRLMRSVTDVICPITKKS